MRRELAVSSTLLQRKKWSVTMAPLIPITVILAGKISTSISVQNLERLVLHYIMVQTVLQKYPVIKDGDNAFCAFLFQQAIITGYKTDGQFLEFWKWRGKLGTGYFKYVELLRQFKWWPQQGSI